MTSPTDLDQRTWTMPTYKQKRPIKGVYVRWFPSSSKVFPDYREVSGSIVSAKRLNRARELVKNILEQDKNIIEREFKKRCSGTPKVDIEMAKRKVDKAKLSSTVKPDESFYGLTTGEFIWITPMKMSDEFLIGTLLHEALHDICTVNGKNMCENDEHIVMRALGDKW